MKTIWKERWIALGDNLLRWQWVEWFLYWMLMSAGVISGCAFLLASIWMSLNANIHAFILLFLTESETVNLSDLSTAAYVALPECILFLALVTVIGHARTWFYGAKKDKAAITWAILYSVPTLVFLVLSVFTLGASVLNAHFEMPGYFVVTRAIAGYTFGVIAFLYHRIGKSQEVDRLREKDVFIDQLQEQIREITAKMESRIERITSELENVNAVLQFTKNELEVSKNREKSLIESMQTSNQSALEAYPKNVMEWLNSDIKTVKVEDIMKETGHSKRKINGANLQRSPRNPELILVSSVRLWLQRTLPPPTLTVIEEEISEVAN